MVVVVVVFFGVDVVGLPPNKFQIRLPTDSFASNFRSLFYFLQLGAPNQKKVWPKVFPPQKKVAKLCLLDSDVSKTRQQIFWNNNHKQPQPPPPHSHTYTYPTMALMRHEGEERRVGGGEVVHYPGTKALAKAVILLFSFLFHFVSLSLSFFFFVRFFLCFLSLLYLFEGNESDFLSSFFLLGD